MCAAPGGKTLAILQSLFGHVGASSPSIDEKEKDHDHVIVANEISRSRRSRLERVLADYVPLPLQRSSLVLTETDGTLLGSASVDPQNGLHFVSDAGGISSWAEGGGRYTHILCDVPCSGEWYTLQSSSSLAKWSEGSSRHLQKTQLSLLKAAVSACRPGGTIVYSTCSINVLENDGIVEKLLHKRGDHVEIQADALAGIFIGEKTKYGRSVLPDHASCAGMGPMYVCALLKK